jgi:hypothetical protein
MYEVTIGKEGFTYARKYNFPYKAKCDYCSNDAYLTFVSLEVPEDDSPANAAKYSSKLHPIIRDNGNLLLNDCCVAAIYLCCKCNLYSALVSEREPKSQIAGVVN